MRQPTNPFSADKKRFSPAGGAVVEAVLKPDPEHAAEREPVGGIGDPSTLMRTATRRVQGESP